MIFFIFSRINLLCRLPIIFLSRLLGLSRSSTKEDRRSHSLRQLDQVRSFKITQRANLLSVHLVVDDEVGVRKPDHMAVIVIDDRRRLTAKLGSSAPCPDRLPHNTRRFAASGEGRRTDGDLASIGQELRVSEEGQLVESLFRVGQALRQRMELERFLGDGHGSLLGFPKAPRLG